MILSEKEEFHTYNNDHIQQPMALTLTWYNIYLIVTNILVWYTFYYEYFGYVCHCLMLKQIYKSIDVIH